MSAGDKNNKLLWLQERYCCWNEGRIQTDCTEHTHKYKLINQLYIIYVLLFRTEKDQLYSGFTVRKETDKMAAWDKSCTSSHRLQ